MKNDGETSFGCIDSAEKDDEWDDESDRGNVGVALGVESG